jgi:FkbM family methyltransferase
MIENLVYDVGMGDGADTAYYLAKGRRVVAIDANPLAVERASQTFADAIRAKRLTILNIGISKEEGPVPFWICDGFPEWSSFHPSIASRDGLLHHKVTVECRSFASVLAEFGVPCYLKLDIEANEIHCLRDLSATDLPEYVSFEKSGYEKQELRLLKELGYTGFKILSQFHFLPVEFPPTHEQRRFETAARLAKSQNFFVRAARRLGMRNLLDREIARYRVCSEWTFPMGSSGPLSEETKGKWQSYDQILETFARAEAARESGKPSIFWRTEEPWTFWADFHARRVA